jgi:hypothetical protein
MFILAFVDCATMLERMAGHKEVILVILGRTKTP